MMVPIERKKKGDKHPHPGGCVDEQRGGPQKERGDREAGLPINQTRFCEGKNRSKISPKGRTP